MFILNEAPPVQPIVSSSSAIAGVFTIAFCNPSRTTLVGSMMPALTQMGVEAGADSWGQLGSAHGKPALADGQNSVLAVGPVCCRRVPGRSRKPLGGPRVRIRLPPAASLNLTSAEGFTGAVDRRRRCSALKRDDPNPIWRETASVEPTAGSSNQPNPARRPNGDKLRID
jgi:hypothetical protein